jgi:hypothetical protein
MEPGKGADRVEPTRRLAPERKAVFSNLAREGYRVTRDEDWAYNCIAHAAGRNDAPWWPTEEPVEGVIWPDGVPREETLEAFARAYGTIGIPVAPTRIMSPASRRLPSTSTRTAPPATLPSKTSQEDGQASSATGKTFSTLPLQPSRRALTSRPMGPPSSFSNGQRPVLLPSPLQLLNKMPRHCKAKATAAGNSVANLSLRRAGKTD